MSKNQYGRDFDSLQRIFADLTDNAARDPLERILVLTYEFDDQQLINLIAGRPLDDNFELHANPLRFIHACQPVVLYDARKTRESSQLPHFLDLIPVKARAYSCHHSKAYLILTRQTIRLVLGSFNLTYTGLFSNREVFKEFVWSSQARAEGKVLSGFIELLKHGYGDHVQASESESLRSICANIEQRMTAWGVMQDDGACSLLLSGYPSSQGQRGLDRLSEAWARISDAPPRRVLAISPFFDAGTAKFADDLEQALGAFGELTIITDTNTICKGHFNRSSARRRLHRIAPAVSDAEKARISLANGGEKLDDVVIERKLHAKILVLFGAGPRHLCYMGSANFTRKAWNGDNHELGLVWEIPGAPGQIEASLRHSLSASDECEYAGLPEALPQEADADPLYGDEGYPDFIERILLEEGSESETVRFRFITGQQGCLAEFDIHWDALAITVVDGCSQLISWPRGAIPACGKRNLRFVRPGGAGPAYHVPFYHADALRDHASFVLFTGAEDWLQHYLARHQQGGGDPDERLPEESDDGNVASPEIDREANTVIAMQRYLTLFAAVERVFEERAAEIADSPDRAERYERHIAAPIRLYAGLLRKELGENPSELSRQTYAFKMGELALFCRALTSVLPEAGILVAECLDDLPTEGAVSAALNIYLTFCKKEAA